MNTKVDNEAIRRVITDIVEKPAEEWQSDTLINAITDTSCSYIDLHDAYKKAEMYKNTKNIGMCLYIEATKKYHIDPTSFSGVKLKAKIIDRWLARAYRFTHNSNYRDNFYRPMMYKLNELNK